MKKYLKYKTKYNNEKKMKGGSNEKNYESNISHITSDEHYNNFKNIFGPYELYILKNNTDNKTFFLFSDFHKHCENDIMNDYIYFPDFLDKLFNKHSDYQFDFFTELGYYESKNIKQATTYNLINNINRKFRNCYADLTDKKKCEEKYRNVRFHATDLRNHYLEENCNSNNYICQLFNIMNQITNHLTQLDTILSDNELNYDNEDKYMSLINWIDNLNNELFNDKNLLDIDYELLKKDILNAYKINKIFANTKYTNVINKLNIFVNYEINKLDKTEIKNLLDYDIMINKDNIIDEIWSSIDDDTINKNDEFFYVVYPYIIKFVEEIKTRLHAIEMVIIKATTIVMDVYTLSRALKCDNYITKCKNIIILAGNNHIHKYVNFLVNVCNYEIKTTKKTPITTELKNQYADNIEYENALINTLYDNPCLRYISISASEIEKYLIR